MVIVRGFGIVFMALVSLAIGYESAFFARAAAVTAAFALGVWYTYATQNEVPAIVGVVLAIIFVTVWWMVHATIVVS